MYAQANRPATPPRAGSVNLDESRSTPSLDGCVAAIGLCVERAYNKYVPSLEPRQAPMTAYHRRAVIQHQVWGAIDSGTCVGVLELNPGDGHMLIENIAVDPKAQRKGLGRRLMTLAEQKARRQGCAEVHLHTNESYPENIAFYRGQGHVKAWDEPYIGSTLVLMRKPIAPRDEGCPDRLADGATARFSRPAPAASQHPTISRRAPQWNLF